MKSLIVIIIVLLATLAHADEAPEGVLRKAYYDEEVKKRNVNIGITDDFYGDLIELYETGELKGEASYKDGKKNGPEKMYYLNGQLLVERNFKDGKIDGLQKNYYESGELEGELFYKDGKKEGIAKVYYKNGQLSGEWVFKDGVLMEQKSYAEDGNLVSK